MIIHCLTCGKSVSNRHLACPYCKAEITDMTLQANGIEARQQRGLKERTKIGFLHALARR